MLFSLENLQLVNGCFMSLLNLYILYTSVFIFTCIITFEILLSLRFTVQKES